MKKILIFGGVVLVFLATLLFFQKPYKKPAVLTTFYPTYALTKAVTGDLVDVQQIVPQGIEVHDFQPSTTDIVKIKSADLVIYNDKNLETWVTSLVGRNGFEASQSTNKIKGDPHTWLSPKQAAIMVGSIEAQLEKTYPEFKSQFKENADKYIKQLDDLDYQYTQKTQSAANKKFIVQHRAFSYLARDYGLQQIAIVGISPEEEPSLKNLANLKNEMQKNKLNTVYFETNVSDKVAQTLIKATGAKLEVLNTAEAQESKRDFLDILKDNLESLSKSIK